MLSELLVVHFVGSADRFQINGIGIPEYPETLVNEHIVNEEVGKTVNGNAKPDPEQVVEARVEPEPEASDTGRGENDEEVIVLLKEIAIVALVMIMV